MLQGRQGRQGGPPVSPLLREAGQGDPAAALRLLQTTLDGLDAEAVEERRKTYGRNDVAHERPPYWWVQLAQAFNNPFIIILLVLGAVSYLTDVWLPAREMRQWAANPSAFEAKPERPNWDKVVILAVMIGLSGSLRFWQEFRSTRAAEKLKALVHTTATVSRLTERKGSRQREVPIASLVPGDIVHLSAGDMIPADVRLLTSKDLFVSESALTGEAMPVEKYSTAEGDGAQSPLEMRTLCFMGTNVLSGAASAVVVATGRQTFFGSLAGSILGSRPLTSFDIGVSKISFLLVKFMLLMVPIVMLINGVTKHDWKEALLFGLAVAVGLTPEMLPLVVSANLARGAIAMSKRKVIVKRLNAIQNFGAMDVLCTDKTGTLTEDKVVLVQYLDMVGKSSPLVLKIAVLNSFFQTGLKNLLDLAVIEKTGEAAASQIAHGYEKVDEIPFDFTRRRMSVVLAERETGNHLLLCKGGVEETLEVCSRVQDEGGERPLTEADKRSLIAFRDTLNADGLRVLAVASKALERDDHPFGIPDENALTLIGYIAFLDPPKRSAREAIHALAHHGVAIKVITGDNAVVAAKVCREVGLRPGEAVLGSQVEAMSDADLGELASRSTLFAKMNPLQKARVIRVLKARGSTVGYLGDGINDSAALRDADVGISVDSAVDIAKESADIILLKKSLLVLKEGIVEGRVVFGNIVKYIKMTTSSNFGNVFSILTASAFLPFLPMLALQILVQNLLYDISQLSLPWDRMDREFVERPRKWEAGGVMRFMVCIGPISSIFDITTFYILWTVFGANSIAHQALFHSGWFVEGLLSQTLIVHMIRTQKIPFIQSAAAPPVIVLTLAVMALGIAIPFTAFGASIGLPPLPAAYFPWLIATLLAYCLLTQVVKRWYIRRFGEWL